MLSPLYKAGRTGIKMQSGSDRKWRHCHPIFATFVGDYPEQTLVACVKRGECYLCQIHRDNVGESHVVHPHRDLEVVLTALEKITQGPVAFANACEAAGIKPVQRPFWQGLPYVNIYYSITPDVLHQLYQGVVKHLISWLRTACGDAEVNARCRRLPPNHQLRYFAKGISHLQRVTGREHSQISSFLLSLVIDTKLISGAPSPRLIQAVQAILDFTFLAQYPVHSTETLDLLDQSLQQFHNNKDVFVHLGIRSDFNIPKLHSMEHYVELIKLFGTTDNYNTEYTERLHIDMTKKAYRSTNFKDEFPQMTLWLEHCEKIFEHESLIKWRLSIQQPTPQLPTVGVVFTWSPKLTKYPSVKGVSAEQLIKLYGAQDLKTCLAEYITWRKFPERSWRSISTTAQSVNLPHLSELHFSIYHFLKFTKLEPYGPEVITDSIHARSARKNKRGQPVPGRFDTVLIASGTGDDDDPSSEFRILCYKQN